LHTLTSVARQPFWVTLAAVMAVNRYWLMLGILHVLGGMKYKGEVVPVL